MAFDKTLGHFQLMAHPADFILEEPAERLAEPKSHLIGKSTDIVVALDDHTRNAQAFNAVRIDCTLRQPLGIRDLPGLCIEYLDEVPADDLAFLFRVSHAFQILEELFRSIHACHVQSKSLVSLHYLCKFVLAQHAMINEDTGKVLADCLVEQYRTYGRVDTAGKTEDDTVIADLSSYLLNSALDERGCTPFLPASADVNYKVLQQLFPLQGVVNFRVELHCPYRLRLRCECSILDISCRCDGLVICRDGRYCVAMTHPDLRPLFETCKETVVKADCLQIGTTVLTRTGLFYLSSI